MRSLLRRFYEQLTSDYNALLILLILCVAAIVIATICIVGGLAWWIFW